MRDHYPQIENLFDACCQCNVAVKSFALTEEKLNADVEIYLESFTVTVKGGSSCKYAATTVMANVRINVGSNGRNRCWCPLIMRIINGKRVFTAHTCVMLVLYYKYATYATLTRVIRTTLY